mgnify:CR=1 FL=1
MAPFRADVGGCLDGSPLADISLPGHHYARCSARRERAQRQEHNFSSGPAATHLIARLRRCAGESLAYVALKFFSFAWDTASRRFDGRELRLF